MGEEQGLTLRLEDLVEPARWQRLQDHFANVLGLGLRTVTARRHLWSSPSWPAGLDSPRLIEALKLGDEIEVLLPDDAPLSDPTTITTPLGLSFAAIPLRATAQQLLGYVVVGPVVLGKREEPEQFRERALSLGVSVDSAWSLLLTIKVCTFLNFRSVLQLLEEVTGIWLELAQQTRRLQALLVQTPPADPATLQRYTERLLQSLLEAATSATEAEGGSVMLYEPSRDVFRIAAAQGLDAHIVSTSITPQESLAGLAIRTRTVLLVDDRVQDAQVKRRMHRRNIASSMVAPLISETTAEPVGVLSVRTSQTAQRFTREDVELLTKFATLAQTALSSLSLLGRSGR